MVIGIDASRAFLPKRTGIEEYSYQVIKHLRKDLENSQVILYIRNNQEIDFKLPSSWRIKVINFPYLWTQIGLSLEMLFNPVDALFVPAHTVPCVHPKNTIVTIHGLEYEFCPEAYSWWEKFYMRWSIKKSCAWASRIAAVSENTKKDLMRLYNVPEERMEVVYEGYDIGKPKIHPPAGGPKPKASLDDQISKPYLLFIGRLEERKNIIGIIKTFEILKEHYKIPHKLVLAGKFGYGAEKIKAELQNTNCQKDIILPGFVRDEDKFALIKGADVFLFPTFYEGFGIPVLESQSVGVPVVAGNNSSIPEAADGSAILVDPMNAEAIADATFGLINDKNMRDDIIAKGYSNVKRFSWEKCAHEIAVLLG